MKTIIFLFGITIVALIIFSSCEKVCDAILKSHQITIVDTNGSPISGLELEIINLRTGHHLCTQLSNEQQKQMCFDEIGESPNHLQSSGVYTIISSFNIADSTREGDVKNKDVIEVRGLINGISFSNQFSVLTDSCNLLDVIGPEVIVVEVLED